MPRVSGLLIFSLVPVVEKARVLRLFAFNPFGCSTNTARSTRAGERNVCVPPKNRFFSATLEPSISFPLVDRETRSLFILLPRSGPYVTRSTEELLIISIYIG